MSTADWWNTVVPGTCKLCGAEIKARGAMKHYGTCLAASQESSIETIVFRATAPGAKVYWLDIEAALSCKLSAVDRVLRHSWVECCGHMSEFRYGRDEVPMSTTLGALNLAETRGITYDYDFGSTTRLLLKFLGSRRANLSGARIRSVGQNRAPAISCDHCENDAVLLCPYCFEPGDVFFCASHAAEHGCCDAEELLPVVNSPRMGVCGYTGE